MWGKIRKGGFNNLTNISKIMEGDKTMKKEMESLPMRMIKHKIRLCESAEIVNEELLKMFLNEKEKIEMEEEEFQKNKKVWIIHGFKNNEE